MQLDELSADCLSTYSTYGWGRMTFHNRTHVTYEYIASGNSSVVDSATLYKEHKFHKK